MDRKFLKLFLAVNSLLFLLTILLIIRSYPAGKAPHQNTSISRRFLLTDLCLSTESRHTRHLTQIELIAPYQDAPGYHDHFPSSTFIAPPAAEFWSVSTAQDSVASGKAAN